MDKPSPDDWVGLHLHEVVPDIWQFRLPMEIGLDHINVYLIREDAGWCAFDTGIDSKAVRDIWLSALSGPIKDGLSRIVVSHHHSDHLGLAAWLQEITGAKVYVRPEELASSKARVFTDSATESTIRYFFTRNGMPATDADLIVGDLIPSVFFSTIPKETMILEHGQCMAIGRYMFEVLVTGGHSVAQVALYAPSGGLFLSGDQMLERITPNVGLWYYGDTAPLKNFFSSLDQIASRDLRIILPAHYNVYSPRKDRAEALRVHHRQMLTKFHERLLGRMTAFDLAKAVFGTQPDILNRVLAVVETLAHLQWLQKEGTVARHDDEHNYQYERIN